MTDAGESAMDSLPGTISPAQGVHVLTFGCRLNSYESEVMKSHAMAAGLDNAILVNTCAVTAEAERQARQAIRRARKHNPDAEIIVTGCSAQVNPAMYADMPEVSRVIGNAEKLKADSYVVMPAHVGIQTELNKDWIPAFAGMTSEKIQVNDIMSVKETALHLVQGFEGKARAFVQVQNGCNHRCTFCIIPYGRGNSRSVPVGEIVSQVRMLVDNGTKEIVLTGVDISAYGEDLPGAPTLGQMTHRLLTLVPELPRLRISSIDAVEVDEDLYRLMAEEPRLMPHMHVSLQAGDDMVLKRMKRRHLRKDILNFCAKVRSIRPDMVFGADLIAGFPTETEEMFKNTLEIVEEAELTYLHVFPYSARPGTPAARMPQVPKSLAKERAARLRAAGEQRLHSYLASRTGVTESVLMETETTGRSEHFAPVRLMDAAAEPGALIKAKVLQVQQGQLMGIPVP